MSSELAPRTVGYTGGRNPRPSYESVCGGDGHTEAGKVQIQMHSDAFMFQSSHQQAIQIEYDPEEVSDTI